jgi:hypothetical protein
MSALVASLGVAALWSGCAPAKSVSSARRDRAAVYEVSFRRSRPVVAYSPAVEGMPAPAWIPVSGKWRSEGGGFVAEKAGELRSASIDIGPSDFRVEVCADVSGAGEREGDPEEPLLAVAVGELRAGLPSAKSVFVEVGVGIPGKVGGETGGLIREGLGHPLRRGRFWFVLEAEEGLVSAKTRRNRGVARRDVFRRWTRGRADGVGIRAAAGVRVYEARVRTLPRRARPEALASGDEALVEGRTQRAGALYSEALADDRLLARERAEAAYKLGLAITDTEPTDAARALDRAQRLDPEGPWGERARLELGRAALRAGREDLALAFAHRLATNAAPRIEDWRGFQDLVSTAREKVVEAEQGARATHQLKLIAQYIEWSDSPRERALWAWNEVARSYYGRGWYAEADAVRDRAEIVLSGGGFLGRLFDRLKFWGGRSKDAPSVLPEPEADRGRREKRGQRARRAARKSGR